MFKKNYKTTGIILRRIAYQDADLILTILTDDEGKIDCIAKGARVFKNRFHGRLELLNCVKLEVFEGRSLDRLNEAEVISVESQLGQNLKSSSVAFFMAEITQKMLEKGQQIDGVYPLLYETIELLGKTARPESLLCGYLIKLLNLTGFMPSWRVCAKCSEKLILQEPIYLSSEGLAPHCQKCNHPEGADPLPPPSLRATAGYSPLNKGEISRLLISQKHLRIVHFMQQENMTQIIRLSLDSEMTALWQWLSKSLNEILPKPMKSAGFLEETLIKQ